MPKVIAAGGLAGAIAGGACTPQDVIKTRLQTKSSTFMCVGLHVGSALTRRAACRMGTVEGRYSGFLDCAKTVIKEEGFGALYKGAINRMLVQAPLFGIALFAFELQKEMIRKQMQS